MINTVKEYFYIQKSTPRDTLPNLKNNRLSFCGFMKPFLGWCVVGVALKGLSEEALRQPPETVAWVASRTFQVMGYANYTALFLGIIWALHSSSSPSRNITKLVATQEEVDSLRAEISRLQQELAARQSLAPVGTGSVPHSQSIAGAADTSVSQQVPHEPGPVDQRPHFI